MNSPANKPAEGSRNEQIVVIGSGFGGAIVAARLAEAGFPVTLLERGPWRDSLPVRAMAIAERAPFPIGRRLFTTALRTVRTQWGNWTLNRRGFLEFVLSPNLNIICASSVGGGSHAYGGLNLRPPDPDYWQTIGLDTLDMERHYSRVADKLGTRLAPPAQMSNSLHQLLGHSTVLSVSPQDCALPMGMLFSVQTAQPTAKEYPDPPRQPARPGRDGTFGSPSGAKTSLDFAYLHPAIRDHGLKVLDLTEAVRIERQSGSDNPGYRIETRNLRTGKQEWLAASKVFMAAGTINTLELLFRSQHSTPGLTTMPHLGERFFANGDLAFNCKLPPGRSAQPSIPVDGAIRCRPGTRPLGERPWPLMIINSLPVADLPLPGFVKRKIQRSIVIAGMGEDVGGRVRWAEDRLVIHYDPSQSPIYDDIRQAARVIARELNGTLSGGDRPTTAHPMGGACLSRDPALGVVDLDGEVRNNPGLYVCDAAALPRPLGGPPSLTIGAWAEHVAAAFVARYHSQRSTTAMEMSE